MRWMMYRWWCEGGGDRAWWVIESVFLRSPDKGFWACLGDIPPDMPRRPETWVSLFFRQGGKLVVNSDDMTTDQKHWPWFYNNMFYYGCGYGGGGRGGKNQHRGTYPNKHETLNQCRVNAGPPSTTSAQHWSNIVSMCLLGQWSQLYKVPPLKWNESGFRSPLCTYRLNWARRTSWGSTLEALTYFYINQCLPVSCVRPL